MESGNVGRRPDSVSVNPTSAVGRVTSVRMDITICRPTATLDAKDASVTSEDPLGWPVTRRLEPASAGRMCKEQNAISQTLVTTFLTFIT
ncbi:hypothetical protein GDO86_014549 [Hymenochirus boettgeri]|uniref:Uncharacterized protein n=1 Tax=Hymenochirus boettgeri TaxID=247094 RepID=A0A8T2JU61_9PIPI|nr:hypothetical protein GDO86_014549 [Hymenochirus boettgeri]